VRAATFLIPLSVLTTIWILPVSTVADSPALAIFDGGAAPTDLRIAHAASGYTLAYVPREGLAEFKGELLMPDSPGDYYIMRVGSQESLKRVSGVIPYFIIGEDAIFKTDPAGAAKMSALGWGLTRLTPLAPSRKSSMPESPPITASTDSSILEMVSDITPQSSRQIIADLSGIRTRYSYAQGCREAEQYIYNYFTQLEYSTSFFEFQYSNVTMRNVIGEKLGEAHPESIIIVCGHLDCTSETPQTLAPGAEDNASGSAVVLEAARVFSEYPTDLTVRFVTFSGEEQGLIGSDLYAAYVQNRQETIAAVINVDMVGYSGPYTQDMHIFSDPQSYWLGALGASIISEYTNLDTVTNYERQPRYGSDHYPFAIRGFPAIFFIDAWDDFDWYPYYHTVADTLGNLNMNQQASIGQAVAAITAMLIRPDFEPRFVAGDVNNSGDVNGIDVIYLVSYLKGGQPPPEPPLRADANGSCNVNGIDVIYLVAYLKSIGGSPIYGDCN